MKTITLIRGLPGSGKSTLAQAICRSCDANAAHCEADQYFMVDGKYVFNHRKIKEAHEFCQNKAEDAMKCGRNVVVANTFVRKWEMEHYKKLAEKYGYGVQEVACIGDFGNIHNVPSDVIERMRSSFDN